MRFLEANDRFHRAEFSREQAAECMDVSVSAFYRKRRRFAEEGEQGLVDGRIGKMSARRAPVDEAMRVIPLFETQYFDFTVKHFHEKLVEPAYPTYIRAAARYALGLARGFAPLTPPLARPKAIGNRAMRTTVARVSGVFIRLHSEEKELLRLNAGIHDLSVSDYIRQTCLSFRLRKSPLEKERLRQLARIGANLNQIARWANTCKRTVEAVEILTTLASLEREIGAFMAAEKTEDEA
ncbi:MAG: plasmid mobilization relaxosome protein MobC [Desulfovibrio sp.]|nr:plasmid mobilization relaxosome protein MobC [Desulfovibrio sp.]